MQQKTIIIGLLTLILGLGLGFGLGSNRGEMGMRDNHRGDRRHDELVKNEPKREVSMESMMGDMNASLTGKTGDTFDQAFLKEMIVHHQGAVAMAELALTNAQHQEVKDMAVAIIAAQNAEIAQMQNWQKDWYQATTTASTSGMVPMMDH